MPARCPWGTRITSFLLRRGGGGARADRSATEVQQRTKHPDSTEGLPACWTRVTTNYRKTFPKDSRIRKRRVTLTVIYSIRKDKAGQMAQ